MFLIDVLETADEKAAYLKQMKKEVTRVVDCFSAPKIVSLREYADPLKSLPDNCPEFQEFISLMIDKYSTDRNDSRTPSNRQLKALADRELSEYMHMLTVIDDLIKTYEGAPPEKTADEELKELTRNPNAKDNPPDYFEKNAMSLETAFTSIVQSEETEKEITTEKKESGLSDETNHQNGSKIKIVWHGSSTSLMKLFNLLSEDGLLKKNINGEVKEFVKKYLVNPDGKEIALQ
jgi:hypothetical protein